MKINTIVISVGHMGKTNNPFDVGSKFEGLQEADLALKYATCIHKHFQSKEYKTFLITHGTYNDRISWANKNTVPPSTLYLDCHINSGGGKYSLVEHYHDAGRRTRHIAKLIARELVCKLGTSYPDDTWAPNGVKEIGPRERGWTCLNGTRMSAILLEPLFIDNIEHMQILKNRPSAIAAAVYNAVDDFNYSLK